MTQTATTNPSIRSRRKAEAARRTPIAPPTTLKEVQDVLARALADLANGEIGAGQARAIAYGCRVLGRLLCGRLVRLKELEKRVAELAAARDRAGLAPRQPAAAPAAGDGDARRAE
ncbi:MAG TPA: hypothetical protein VMS17_19715 [Gemmataceae bacterium]|nr:hypothetical protein [Gemmataceae bacterium]